MTGKELSLRGGYSSYEQDADYTSPGDCLERYHEPGDCYFLKEE